MTVIIVPPNELGWNSINSCTAVTVLTTVAVALRFFTRWHRKVKLGADDWAALVTLILLLGMYIQMILWVVIGGQGYHVPELYEISPSILIVFGQMFYANEVTYSLASPAVKISIILFYRRIFPIRYMRITSDIVIVAHVLWGLSMLIGSSTQCIPLAKAWDPTIPGSCFDSKAFILALAGLNVFFDTIIFIMPIKPIWGLHRPWQDKAALTFVFVVGSFVCFASMYRISTLLVIDMTDITFTTYQGAIWTFLEPCAGLFCGCLPVIRGLFPVYTIKRPTMGRITEPLFLAHPRQETLVTSVTPGDTTEDYSRMSSVETLDGLPMEEHNKIRVRTTINIQR